MITTHVLDIARGTPAVGLTVILEADAQSRDQGWTLVILRGPPAVHLTFEATKTDGRLHIVGDPPPDERA